jgi:nitroreductase
MVFGLEFFDLMVKRRSYHFFTDEPVPAEHLQKIVEAARLAPSAHNYQPCEFIVVTEKDTFEKILELGCRAARRQYGKYTVEELVEHNRKLTPDMATPETARAMIEGDPKYFRKRFTYPALIIVFVDVSRPYPRETAFIAASYMHLAATDLGLGSCIKTGWLASPESRDELAEVLGVPDGLKAVVGLAVGYPDEKPEVSKRSLKEMLHWERFGAH